MQKSPNKGGLLEPVLRADYSAAGASVVAGSACTSVATLAASTGASIAPSACCWFSASCVWACRFSVMVASWWVNKGRPAGIAPATF